jgi:hypothetical protein
MIRTVFIVALVAGLMVMTGAVAWRCRPMTSGVVTGKQVIPAHNEMQLMYMPMGDGRTGDVCVSQEEFDRYSIDDTWPGAEHER